MKKFYRISHFAIILIAWSLLGAACQPQSAAPAATNPPEALLTSTPATAAATPTPGADQARSAVIQALLALNTRPNRMEVTTVPEGGAAQTNVIEFIPPDSKHITSAAEGVEYIVAGGKVYAMTRDSGKWEETQIQAAAFLPAEEPSEAVIAKTVSEAQFLRVDTLDGKAVVVYSYASTTSSGGFDLLSQTELWLGAADGLPCQMIIKGDILSVSTDPASGESKMKPVPALTTTLITFDDAIRIEPPALNP